MASWLMRIVPSSGNSTGKRRAISASRSPSERYRPESGFAESPNIAGGMPPAFRNHLVRQPAIPRPEPQPPRLPRLPRLPPRTVAADHVSPPAVDQVTATAPAQIDPNV